MQSQREQDWESAQQTRVVATMAQDFESDEDVSDGEGDRVTLFSSAGQLPPSGQADADTLPVMPREQLDTISEETRWVCPNSAPQKLGFSEELSSPTRSLESSIVRKLTSGLLQGFSVLRPPLMRELRQAGRSVHSWCQHSVGGLCGVSPPSSEPQGG